MPQALPDRRMTRERLRAKARLANAYLMLLFAQLAMSSGGIFGRFALAEVGPLQTAALRLSLAAVPLLLGALWRRARPAGVAVELQLAGAGLALAVVFGAWTGSLMRLSVGASTLLTCTAPFWNGLYETLVLRRKSPPSFWVALAVACGSVALMASDSTGSPPLAGQAGLGVCLALGSSVAMAGYYILVRRITQNHPTSTVDIITRTYSWAAVVLVALCLVWERQPLPPLQHWRPWMGIVGLAAVTQGCGHTLQNFTLRVLRPSVVSFAALSEPLIASVMAIFIFGETVTLRLVGGGGALLLALGWAMNISRRMALAATPARPAPAAQAPTPTPRPVDSPPPGAPRDVPADVV